MTIQTIQSRTKSGKQITVALIPVSLLCETAAEARDQEASRLAQGAGCGARAWRIVDVAGNVMQLPSATYAEAASRSCGANERHDW